jgi:ribonuclease/clavin/mitogillin
MRAYVSSLRRLWARNPATCYPSHGPVIADPRETCARLIAHRRDREERVREAVEGGARTVGEITTVAYEKDLSGVRDMAEATVVAHLEKLAVEGQVRWDGAEAAPT